MTAFASLMVRRPRRINKVVNVTYVTPGYFEALRMTLVSGRTFDDRDSANSMPVAIVALARFAMLGFLQMAAAVH
jgi:hypothetical protein